MCAGAITLFGAVVVAPVLERVECEETATATDHDWRRGVGRYHHDHPLRITRGDSRGRGDHPAWGSGGRPLLSRGSRMRGETPERKKGLIAKLDESTFAYHEGSRDRMTSGRGQRRGFQHDDSKDDSWMRPAPMIPGRGPHDGGRRTVDSRLHGSIVGCGNWRDRGLATNQISCIDGLTSPSCKSGVVTCVCGGDHPVWGCGGRPCP